MKQNESVTDIYYFVGIFESIYFCNLGLSDEEQLEYISKRKATICHEIGVDVLIDHQLEHCLECAQGGIDVLLYDRKGQYKWNHDLPPSFFTSNIQRITTWKNIVQHHFPKPNSPLRHLAFPLDDDEDDDTTTTYNDDNHSENGIHLDDDWDMMIV
jgi:hypothetical protein